MANMSAQPRPEERSPRRSVSKDAPPSANGVSAGPFFETSRVRATPQNEVCGRVASPYGCGWVRVLAPSLGAIAVTLAASLAFADPQSPLSPSAADVGAEMRMLAPLAFEVARGSFRRASSPQSPSNGRASFGHPMVGEDQGGGSRCAGRVGGSASANLLGLRDPPPTGRSEERPSLGGLWPPPHRAFGRTPVSRRAMGGGCANAIDFAQMKQAQAPASKARYRPKAAQTPERCNRLLIRSSRPLHRQIASAASASRQCAIRSFSARSRP
jgi:hypothetical protein